MDVPRITRPRTGFSPIIVKYRRTSTNHQTEFIAQLKKAVCFPRHAPNTSNRPEFGRLYLIRFTFCKVTSSNNGTALFRGYLLFCHPSRLRPKSGLSSFISPSEKRTAFESEQQKAASTPNQRLSLSMCLPPYAFSIVRKTDFRNLFLLFCSLNCFSIEPSLFLFPICTEKLIENKVFRHFDCTTHIQPVFFCKCYC